MRKIKDNLYEFDPQIYPRLLWIGIGKEQFQDALEDVPELAYRLLEGMPSASRLQDRS